MAKQPHDDLFQQSTMTFGEHLEELRVCLFRGVVGIAVGCLIGLFVANDVVRFFQGPLEQAMEEYYLDNAQAEFDQRYGELTYEARRMILDEKLVPEALQIDAGRLSEVLRLNYPERFAGVELSPYWFTAGDFLEDGAKRLCQRLIAAKDRAGTAYSRVWQLLTPDEQGQIAAAAQSGGPLSHEQLRDVLAALNALAGRRELHEAEELADVAESGADLTGKLTSELTSRLGFKSSANDPVAGIRAELAEQFDPEQSRRLNKLLLARLFPESLRRARVSLIPLFAWRPVKIKFQSLNAQEPFMIWMKAALMTGLVIASPYVFYQIWTFVAAGLYPHEKHYVHLYLPVSVTLFIAGASLAFVFVFQPVLRFLFTFNQGMNAEFEPRIGEWLSFVLILPLGFGISFQLPLVMLFLNRLGLVSLELFLDQWRIAVLVICVVSMVLTPADPVSMMLMAVPLCFLYLLGILMCKYMPRGRNPFEEAYEP